MFARSVLLHAIQPPVGNIERLSLGAVVSVVINRAGILPVERVPTAIVRRILQTFLDHAHRAAVHVEVIQVLVAAAEMPLAAHEGLVARRLEGLRHQMLAQIKATLVVGAVTNRVAARHQGGASHAANRRRIEAFQTNARRRKTIHVRCLNRHLTRRRVITHIAPTLVIGDDDDNVRSRHRCDRERESLRGAASGRIGHFCRKIEGACLSWRAAQNAATVQRDAIGQRTAEKAPNIARAASARGGQSLVVSTRRAAIRQGRCRDDRRSRSDGVARAARCRGAARSAGGRDGEVHRRSIGLRGDRGTPETTTEIRHTDLRGRSACCQRDGDVVDVRAGRTRR